MKKTDLNIQEHHIDLNVILHAPDLATQPLQAMQPADKMRFRFARIAEISEGKASAYRLAMENVISSFSMEPGKKIVYVIRGTKKGVSFYLGIGSNQLNSSAITDTAQSLYSAFEGNFPGAKLINLTEEQMHSEFAMHKRLGLITGVPSFNTEESQLEGEDFQGVERLINMLYGEQWQMMITAESCSKEEINDTLERIYDLSTRLSTHIKHSVQDSENRGQQTSRTTGKSMSITYGTSSSHTESFNQSTSKSTGKNDSNSRNSSYSSSSKGTNTSDSLTKGNSDSDTTGSSKSATQGTSDSETKGENVGWGISLTRERIDKRYEEAQKHLSETQIERFSQGRSKGMFKTHIYVSAKDQATYDRLSRGVLSIFQGNRPTYPPLDVRTLNDDNMLFTDLLQDRKLQNTLPALKRDSALVHSIPIDAAGHATDCTWLTVRELALMTGLPCTEPAGLTIRPSVDFALNINNPQSCPDTDLVLGNIMQQGRILEGSPVTLPRNELNKHIFITGVTGSGKTTTCMNILRESNLPFMVIEPAKNEYRTLYTEDSNIEYYVLGKDKLRNL